MAKKLSSQALAARQALAMWALLGNGGSGFGSKLKPEIEKEEREALRKAGLITVEKKKRRLWSEITDRGWRWAEDHLGDSLPDTKHSSVVLHIWLTRIQSYMHTKGVPLSEILLPAANQSSIATSESKNVDPEEIVVDYAMLRERIREAYLKITGGSFHKRVLLSDIRQRLQGIDRDVLDGALSKMHFEEGTMLMGSDNPLEITPAMRDAQINVRGETMHILWIVK